MTNKTTTKYSPEVRERTVRMVFERQGEHGPAVGGDRLDRGGDRLPGGDLARPRNLGVEGAYPSHGTSSARVREAIHLICNG
jgi:hypothetical protein